MNIFAFLTVSMWEWFAMYRFEINQYIGQLAFTAFLLALFSFMLFNVFELKMFATLIQPIVVFLFFWLMFKVPPLYSGLIAVNGYLAYCLVTSLLYFTAQRFGIAFTPATPQCYAIQLVTGLMALLIARLFVKLRWGFSFVQAGGAAAGAAGTNAKLLLLVLVGYVSLASFNFLYYGAGHTLLMMLTMIAAFVLFQYWALKKEHEVAFWRRNKKFKIDAP
ncbi:hypothetical protein [Paenibacillus sp. GYB003]|uniref:hypothetical protein n=1 Tax=Paenibacillus sp. GYB003 TaxID=2994392 RepID=UPI002F967C54